MGRPKLLIIDDDANIRTQMKWALSRDYELFLAADGKEALKIIGNEHPPLITLDLGLPPHPDNEIEGMTILEEILRQDPNAKIIVVTGNPNRAVAVEAISKGAHDFFSKPIDFDELKAIIKRSYYVHNLEVEYQELQGRSQQQTFGEIIGTSPQMQHIYNTIIKVAKADVPVLVTGENGTGKELIARSIHNKSLRHNKPFVAINCGAIPESLMESEFFGHEKGSFTGAHILRKGRIEMAEGGTLFLDEIGDLPMPLQVKILRFLHDHKIERVGGRETIEVDVRVVAATNRDLQELVKSGLFREDLYYRLAVVTIDIPPLRERKEDIIPLTKHFLQMYNTADLAPKYISKDAKSAMGNYAWPGNIRELENRIRRAITIDSKPAITSAHIGIEPPAHVRKTVKLKRAIDEFEANLIKNTIYENAWNISKTAEALGVSRPTLHGLIKKFNITR
jgi:two-component system NtrC family response regulator